jgi:hypothetical protein
MFAIFAMDMPGFADFLFAPDEEVKYLVWIGLFNLLLFSRLFSIVNLMVLLCENEKDRIKLIDFRAVFVFCVSGQECVAGQCGHRS